MHTQSNKIVKWFNRKRSLSFVLIFALTMLGTAIYFFSKQNSWLEGEFAKEIQSTELNNKVTKLSLHIKNAESQERGYVLSGNRKYLEPFDTLIDSIIAINSTIQQQESRKEERVIDMLLIELDSLIKQKIGSIKQAKSVYETDEHKAPSALSALNEGLHLSDSITKITTLISDMIELQLKDSQTDFLKVKRKNNNLAFTYVFGSLFLITLIFFLLINVLIKAKKINNELLARKENYRATLNSLGEGLIATNKEGRITYMNSSAEHLTGWRWQEAKGQLLDQVYNVVNEQTGKPIEHIVSRILKGGKRTEWENNTVLKSKNNDSFIISNYGSAILDANNNISGAVLLFNDITEKYRIEKQLKDTEKQYKNLIQNLPSAVYTCDATGHIQLYNKAAVELWGREPIAGKDLWCGSWKIYNKDGTDLTLDNCPMAITLKKSMPVHGKEILIQRPDESYRHVLPYPSPLFNTEGQLTGAINMLIDVTDKKEREILIQKTEEKYRNLVEQASDAILIYSFDGIIHDFNKSCYTMLGYTAQEYAKLRLTDIIEGEIIVNQDNYAAILAGNTKTIYRKLLRKDGSVIEAEVTVRILTDGKAIAIARDVTERKKAEKELLQSNLRLEHAEKQANIGSWQRDLVSNKRYWSKNMFRLFGFEPADHPPTLEEYLEAIHPDDRQNISKRLVKISQGYELPNYEFRTNPERGPIRNLYATFYYEKNDAGVISKYYGCILDVTEIKKAENEIREKELFTRSILTSIRSHIAVIDENGLILEVNDAWNNFSIQNDEMILDRTGKGRNYIEVCQKAADGGDIIAAKVLSGFIQVSKNEIPFFEILYPCHSPEKERWFQLAITKFVGDSGKVVMKHTDITDLKKASKEAADYKNALSQSSILAITDQKGIIKDVNENFCNISQYSAAELIGNDHRIINSGYHSKSFMKNLWATIGSGKIWRGEICNKAKDGTLYWVDSTIVPFLDEKKKPFQYIIIRWDISKRKFAETMMKNAIDRYNILAHATSDTIWDWDIANDRMIYNDGISEMFGYGISEVEDIVDWWKDKLHSDDFKKVQDSLVDVFENGLQRFQLTYRFRCADGSYKHIFDRAFVLFDESGKPSRMIGAMQDVTHQVEEELRIAKAIIDAQEQERNYLGAELHDNINQILAGTLLILGMAKSKEVDTPKKVRFIESAMEYITNVINETRKLSHNLAPASFEDTSLKELFEDLLFNLNIDNRYTIRLHCDELKEAVIPENIQINLYRILQEQTKNILKYAEASNIEIDVKFTGKTISLRIADNGKGFNLKTIKKGIGLSNIRKRAESLSGNFMLNSAPGKGCEIIVEIPLEKCLPKQKLTGGYQ